MAYQPEYHHHQQHPYANYSTPTYIDHHQTNSPVSPHPNPVVHQSHPSSSTAHSNNERMPIPQSPSSFIYNKSITTYPSSSGVYMNQEVNHSPYHPPYPPQSGGQVPVMYRPQGLERHHSLDDQRERQSQHTYGHPPPQDYHGVPRSSGNHLGSSSQHGQEMYAAADVPNVLSEHDDRQMRYYFPYDHQAHLRRALFYVLNSNWKRNNDREPTDEVLLQFTTRNGKLYQCAFHKAEGRCVKEFDRKDRVLDHIRTHIDLQPFCCREAGCAQRFCSKPDLLQHEKNKEKTQCDQCGAKILPKNLARHKATALCRSGRIPAYA